MPSLFRKKSTKSVAQPDPTLHSKAALYDELVAYLQKASSQLASCTDAVSAAQASHEWRYLANTPPPTTGTADDEAASKSEQHVDHETLSAVADLAKILADALTTKAELAQVNARLADTAGELDKTKHALATAQADLNASKSATAAQLATATQAAIAESEHLRTTLDAAWQLVETKSHALENATRELALVTSEARELKQRVEFLEAFKIVVDAKRIERADSGADAADGKQRGLVAADSTATMVEEEDEDEEHDDTRSMGVQTPTPAKMRSKLGIKVGVTVVPRIVVKNVNDEIVVDADGSDEDEGELEVARLVPLL
ncbi:hypothetical protein BCR44DRAFT_1494874 [Catenaria anguillulae PL171]|uniref:Uncharacterized protein n=1 Tax=Catenaria anguillulae PL171 TaxID=765915 RepID=A0A1Y2I4X5_9FUNG|nr:hypothetical protein BCR44DRAFT_1494874 [Catenaria anguillulae PL171]